MAKKHYKTMGILRGISHNRPVFIYWHKYYSNDLVTHLNNLLQVTHLHASPVNNYAIQGWLLTGALMQISIHSLVPWRNQGSDWNIDFSSEENTRKQFCPVQFKSKNHLIYRQYCLHYYDILSAYFILSTHWASHIFASAIQPSLFEILVCRLVGAN